MEVKKGVPLPKGKMGESELTRILRGMDVGDYVFAPGRIGYQISPYFNSHKPKKFTLRTSYEDPKGVHIWRKS